MFKVFLNDLNSIVPAVVFNVFWLFCGRFCEFLLGGNVLFDSKVRKHHSYLGQFGHDKLAMKQVYQLNKTKMNHLKNQFKVGKVRSIFAANEKLAYVKRTLALQLFGGVSRINEDGTRTRGDIHILLMGDPGVAKSQLLRYMSNLSPRGKYASGGGVSAAGLTAAAIKDAFGDGRFALEAGILPLSDQGLAAIDEFDKISTSDQGSMHEAMEQQSIHIAKGGLTARLPTRCAVLAAANPTGGRFSDRHPNASVTVRS